MSKYVILVRTYSDGIHREGCPAARKAQRWIWADRNPDVDWAREFPWNPVCKRCHPPSPANPPTRAVSVTGKDTP